MITMGWQEVLLYLRGPMFRSIKTRYSVASCSKIRQRRLLLLDDDCSSSLVFTMAANLLQLFETRTQSAHIWSGNKSSFGF